jgi:peptidoglycan/LPS O-acetylase OafA/YrhL
MPSVASTVGPAVTAAMPRPQPGRLELLDGVRGWCALSVVFFHVYWETFSKAVPAFRNPATGFFFDGHLAVCVFFVLSGEALSTAFFAGKGDAATVRLAIKRYPRLATPILAACLAMFALDQLGFVFAQQASRVVPLVHWMSDWGRQPLTFSYTLRYALFDVFVSDNAGRAVNPMLWTMPIEFLGSFLVFALLLIWNRFSRPRTLLLGLFVVAQATPAGSTANYLSCFFAGMAFADWRAHGLFAAMSKCFAWAPWAAIGVLAATDGTLQWLGSERGKTAIAIALMFALYASPSLCAFFSGSVSRALGRISFPLYLIQFPVLMSIGSWLTVEAGGDGSLSLAAVWAVSLASAAACVLAALAFAPIETLARGFGDALVAFLGLARGRRRSQAGAPSR